MVRKKAYIRTLEAVIAIVLLLFATYALTPKQVSNPRDTPYAVEAAQEFTVMQVTQDQSLRSLIINSHNDFDAANDSLTATIKKRLPPGYDFSTAICTNPNCITLPELQTSVYMEDIIIAGQTSDTPPESVIRIVRVWFWRAV